MYSITQVKHLKEYLRKIKIEIVLDLKIGSQKGSIKCKNIANKYHAYVPVNALSVSLLDHLKFYPIQWVLRATTSSG